MHKKWFFNEIGYIAPIAPHLHWQKFPFCSYLIHCLISNTAWLILIEDLKEIVYQNAIKHFKLLLFKRTKSYHTFEWKCIEELAWEIVLCSDYCFMKTKCCFYLQNITDHSNRPHVSSKRYLVKVNNFWCYKFWCTK